jgi:hypothetical protein
MPRPWEMKEKFDLVTADFLYVRWLGDRHGIERITQTWDKTVVDRKSDLMNWVDVLRAMVLNKQKVDCNSRLSYLQLNPVQEFPMLYDSFTCPNCEQSFRVIWPEPLPSHYHYLNSKITMKCPHCG